MKSKWKLINYPSLCYRNNFLNCFSIEKHREILPSNNRQTKDNIIKTGSCKKFRLFYKAIGRSFEIWSGHKYNTIQISQAMAKNFLGSYVFTKRITKDIHKKQVQARHKRAFGKKK